MSRMKPKIVVRGVVMKGRSAPPPPPKPIPTGPARVRVGREVAGRSGKGVTVITGLPLPQAELEELGKRLKKLCGAGGAVRDDGVIEVQGEHRDRLVAELAKLGYEAKRSGG